MTLKIDKFGRVVVPKALRERLGVRANGVVEAVEQPEGVLLRAIASRPSMTQVEGLWVHEGRPDPNANWSRVLDDVREERISDTSNRDR